MLDTRDIMNIIPHRYPFLLVDKAEIDEGNNKATGYKNVTMNEYFFAGHFPENPVMPGVLIIEALAQVGAIYILNKQEFKGKTAYFGGIDKVKFKKMVMPGDVLKLEIEMVKIKGPVGIGHAVATVDGELAAKGELTFVIK
ncbi:MAG: 3-hydroxyacyl-[acyl-carrier-protein] dehydratase FabZ [Clostridiales bacterium GWE2_32_10]|nr:MAG: 3-hydroxyacyl-[acyl-carrier-protein] dehydratase FabZ [Clostridiales bacterium GWE2_32_10]HBY20815.1 3-hydroxyacyl-[acyl-carrier-protein] dehydratase FabZ [Clostridiales bacterium]